MLTGSLQAVYGQLKNTLYSVRHTPVNQNSEIIIVSKLLSVYLGSFDFELAVE